MKLLSGRFKKKNTTKDLVLHKMCGESVGLVLQDVIQKKCLHEVKK